MTFMIFNQWGEEVFISQDQSTGWDGTMQGVCVQNGTYTYLLEYLDDNNVKRNLAGHVTVIK